MIQPKAVLFDFDGVVVDSFEAHYGAWKQAFFELFQEEIAPFPAATHAGRSPMEIAAYFCDVIGKKEEAHSLFKAKGAVLHANTTPPKLLPGVKKLTQSLKQQDIPYGIASNATKKFIGNSIKQLALDFSVYFGVEDYKLPKPNPEPYQMLAKALGISETHFDTVIVFEDSITGITAVKKAGMIPVGIQTQHPKHVLKAAGCHYSFPTLLEAHSMFE